MWYGRLFVVRIVDNNLPNSIYYDTQRLCSRWVTWPNITFIILILRTVRRNICITHIIILLSGSFEAASDLLLLHSLVSNTVSNSFAPNTQLLPVDRMCWRVLTFYMSYFQLRDAYYLLRPLFFLCKLFSSRNRFTRCPEERESNCELRYRFSELRYHLKRLA